jgi:thiamine-monophosphate kinase
MVRRSGAEIGDAVMVTGTIGDAALGLDVLRNGSAHRALAGDPAARDYLADRYRVPQPRNAVASVLRAHAHAAMDISDGLMGDLGKLCAVSGVSADIEAAAVPLSAAARQALAGGGLDLPALVAGGDDYEVLFCIPARAIAVVTAAALEAGVATTRIGAIRGGTAPPRLLDAAGGEIPLVRRSFSHF